MINLSAKEAKQLSDNTSEVNYKTELNNLIKSFHERIIAAAGQGLYYIMFFIPLKYKDVFLPQLNENGYEYLFVTETSDGQEQYEIKWDAVDSEEPTISDL